MKKTFLILIFGALLCLSTNAQTSTLTDAEVNQVTDKVFEKTGIAINFDDVLKSGGVLITTYGNGLPDKTVTVTTPEFTVVVFLENK